MSQKDKLSERDAITAAHLAIRATLKHLRSALEKDSFNLRQTEAVVKEASLKGDLRKMNMAVAPGVVGLLRASRNAMDACGMLLERCEKGLDENAKLRDRIAELELQASKRDGVLATV